MDEYLQYKRTLRSQINDVEDQAAKVSVEEQILLAAVQVLQADLSLAKSELLKLKGKAEQISKAKGGICARILEKQKKITCLESGSCMARKGLELIQREKTSLSAKLTENRTYYTKVAEDVHSEFLQLQAEHSQGRVKPNEVIYERKEQNKMDEVIKIMASELQSAKEKLDGVKRRKTSIAVEITETRQHLEQMKGCADNFPHQSKAMDIETLEKEHESLLADISAEADFRQPLANQKEKLEVIKCTCGEQYEVALNHTYTETAGGI